MIDRIIGISTVVSVVSIFFGAAIDIVTKSPTFLGVFSAISIIVTGGLAAASVIRDRLQ